MSLARQLPAQAEAGDAFVGPFARSTGASLDEVLVVSRLFGEHARDGVMIDVGAHRGGSLLRFARRGWRVIAFEPDPDNRQHLLSKLGDLPEVTVDPRAVGAREERVAPFYASEASSGISSLAAFHPSHREICTLEVTTLTSALREHELSQVDFLKIDTEGTDLRVLQGFPWDAMQPKVILCEFEDDKTVRLGYDYRELGDYLVSRGYTVYLSEWHPIIRYGIRHDWHRLAAYPSRLADPRAWGNFLAFRDGVEPALLHAAVVSSLQMHGAPAAAPLRRHGATAVRPAPRAAPGRSTSGLHERHSTRLRHLWHRGRTLATRARTSRRVHLLLSRLRHRMVWIGGLATIFLGVWTLAGVHSSRWVLPWVLLPLLLAVYLRHKDALHYAVRDRQLLSRELRQSKEKLAALASAHDELGTRHEAVLNRLASSQATAAELRDLLDQVNRRWREQSDRLNSRIEVLRAQVDQRFAEERSVRSLAFARRDSTGHPPERCLLLVTIPRSGSTWLLDAMRCHPAVRFEASALLFELLGLRGGRYPRALADRGDASVDIEITNGTGARIPAFELPAGVVPAQLSEMEEPYTIEKIHPDFFLFDPQRLLRRLRGLESRGVQVKLVYQVREPARVAASISRYKRRDPSWYPSLQLDNLVPYLERCFRSLDQMVEILPGPVFDYRELTDDLAAVLQRIYRHLWPTAERRAWGKIASAAAALSSLERRKTAGTTLFFGDEQPAASDAPQDLARCRLRYLHLLGEQVREEAG